jgi:hypothetical protein
MSASPRAVLFDADGVMQSMGPVAAHLRDRFGWSDDRAIAFLHDYWERESECGCLEGRSEFAGVLEELLVDWEIADDPAGFYHDFLTAAIVPDEENLALVTEVRATGILCALATNQEVGRARFMTDTLGYERVFDHLFFSCELQCAKPSPAYFNAILGGPRPAGRRGAVSRRPRSERRDRHDRWAARRARRGTAGRATHPDQLRASRLIEASEPSQLQLEGEFPGPGLTLLPTLRFLCLEERSIPVQ